MKRNEGRILPCRPRASLVHLRGKGQAGVGWDSAGIPRRRVVVVSDCLGGGCWDDLGMNGMWYERVVDDTAEDDHRDGTWGMPVVDGNDRVRQGHQWAKNAMLTKHTRWIGEWDKEKEAQVMRWRRVLCKTKHRRSSRLVLCQQKGNRTQCDCDC